MKYQFLCSFLFTLLVTAACGHYSFLGSCNSNGVPNYQEVMDDVIDLQLLEDINLSLTERKAVPTYHPEYGTDIKDQDILLSKDSDVYVTCAHEGVVWKNTLAFYTYDQNDPPESEGEISGLTIVYPNYSCKGAVEE
ncbi:MAG: hypothetical protein ACI84C_001200 [Flavobacteriales bacterium]|jgi:hypothetical protein